MKKKIKNVAIFIALLLASIMIIGSIYYAKEYPKQEFDQILYYLLSGVEYTAPSIVNSVILSCVIPVVLLAIFLFALTIKNTKKITYLMLKIRKKEFKIRIYPRKFIANHRAIYVTIVYIIAILFVIFGFKIDKYIKNRIQETKIYEEHYVDARNVNIKFPEEKRNLILIIVESLENTVLSKANGGAWEYSIVPELEELALENTNFSHSERLGGGYQVSGANFSAGGIVAMNSGVPLASGQVLEDVNNYKGNGNYLSGAYSLGDILKEQGYNLEVIMGSEATFGGRAQYFNTHGGYKIFDVNYAIEQGKMKSSDKVWWGFEDDKLFKWSKEEINELASKDEPFNFIMITADTHFVDGYLSPNAENKFEMQYENVHAYSSKLIYEFIEWAKQQKFYEDTTIVILGDHLGMQTEFYEAKTGGNYERTIYNTIINPAIEAKNNKNRIFTTVDWYPTILASMGVEIEGDRLGLGTNLYSTTPTLAEELGYDYLNNELAKRSSFYNNYILGEDYYVMKKETQKEEEKLYEKDNDNNTSV